MNKTGILLALGLTITSSSAFAAGKCTFIVTREACSKEMESASFSKCEGKKICDPVTKMVTNEEACVAVAVDACTNSRFKETKSKTVKVEFNGKVVAEDACAKDTPPKFVRKDHFDKCGS